MITDGVGMYLAEADMGQGGPVGVAAHPDVAQLEHTVPQQKHCQAQSPLVYPDNSGEVLKTVP